MRSVIPVVLVRDVASKRDDTPVLEFDTHSDVQERAAIDHEIGVSSGYFVCKNVRGARYSGLFAFIKEEAFRLVLIVEAVRSQYTILLYTILLSRQQGTRPSRSDEMS